MFNYLYDIYNKENDNENNKEDKIIKRSKFIKNLPKYLQKNNNKQSTMVDILPEEVTENELLDILLTMNNGYEYMTFYYLDKKFGDFSKNPKSYSAGMQTEGLQSYNFKDIKKEAYFIFRILKKLSFHPFISKYLNDEKMQFIFQGKIESSILPSINQFKFDLCFHELNIILEINEYYHEVPNSKDEQELSEDEDEVHPEVQNEVQNENDQLKSITAVLCGMSLSSLRLAKVFDMDKAEFEKASYVKLHEALDNSTYLAEFLSEFEFKVLSALVKDAVIRNDYLLFSFVGILEGKLIILKARFIKTFRETGIKSEADLVLIENMEKMILTVKKSKNFLKIFSFKEKCIKSKTGDAITFDEICKVLKFYEDEEINDLVKFLFERTDMIDSIDFDQTTKVFSWEDLYTIVIEYDLEKIEKDALKLYLLYVGKTYENVVKMINSHSDGLVCNVEMLTKYLGHYDKSTDRAKDVTIDRLNKVIQSKNQSIIELKKTINWFEVNRFPKEHFDKDLNYTSNYGVEEASWPTMTDEEIKARDIADLHALYDSIIEIEQEQVEEQHTEGVQEQVEEVLPDLEDMAETGSDLDDSE